MTAVAEVPDWFGTDFSSDWSYGQPPYEWDAFDGCLSVLDRSSSLQDADVSDSSSRIVPTNLRITTTIEDDEASASTRTGFATPTSSVLNDDCHSRPQLLAASDLLEPEDSGSIVRCSCRAPPKLQLDYSGVLSEWNERGGSSAVDAGTAAHESLMLCLPPPASGLNLPSYDLEAAPPELSLSTSHIRPLLDLREENPLRVSSLQPNGSCGMFMGIPFSAEDDGPEDMCEDHLMLAAGLMPPIVSSSPRPYSAHTMYSVCNEALAELPPLPQTLACIPARSTGNSSAARAAAVTRYKDKKLNRQTGKIRYEMRKINAEKRPRIKGRFVKRADLAAALERQLESLSPLSQDSASSETTWA